MYLNIFLKERPLDNAPYVRVFEDDNGITAYFNLLEANSGVQVINAFIQLQMVRTGGMTEKQVRRAIIDFVKRISLDI